MLRVPLPILLPGGGVTGSFNAAAAGGSLFVDLGTGVIRGQVCDHLAFRTPEVDWQIWIAQGDRPYPCRFEITSKLTALAPSYRIDVSDWKAEAGVAGSSFRIESGSAKVVKIDEFGGLDEVKPMLSEGAEQ